MPTLAEGNLTFTFPHDWHASKLDEWSFYRNQFQPLGSGVRVTCAKCGVELCCQACGTAKTVGVKAVDFLAHKPNRPAWLIEVKDYRQVPRTKTVDLADEVALKVRDSLAALVAAAINANDAGEKSRARAAVRSDRIQVVLHLEQPTTHSKLFPRAINPANVQLRLKQLLKSIDPHPQVLEIARPGKVPWTVTSP